MALRQRFRSAWQAFTDDRVWVTREEGERILALGGAVGDVCWKATAYGFTEDGDVHAYLVPKGAIHRLVGAAQSAGLSVSLRAFEAPADTPRSVE